MGNRKEKSNYEDRKKKKKKKRNEVKIKGRLRTFRLNSERKGERKYLVVLKRKPLIRVI